MPKTLQVILALLVLGVLYTVHVSATTQTDGKEAYYQELLKLKRDKPAEHERQHRLLTFVAQTLLGRLGYDVGPFDGVLGDRAQAALRLYQKNRGLPVTGDPLSFETNKQINADYVALNEQIVSLPQLSVRTDAWDAGYVSAEGTWTIQGEELAWPEQTSRIRCFLGLGICLEATAVIETRPFGTGEHLSVELNTYEIERWDDTELVTKPRHDALCVQHILRISRVQESVTGIRSTVSTEELCKGISEKYLVLADGLEWSQKLQKRQAEAWRNLTQVSPSLIEMLNQ